MSLQNIKKTLALALALLLLAGCGGSYSVSRFDRATPPQIRSVAISPRDGNSSEVTGYVSDALAVQGVAMTVPLPAGVVKTDKADAVISYQDVWRWDLATYLQSISINLYNAQTGDLLVTGRWRDSFFHTWNRGESVSKDLIAEMLAKIGAASQPVKEATP